MRKRVCTIDVTRRPREQFLGGILITGKTYPDIARFGRAAYPWDYPVKATEWRQYRVRNEKRYWRLVTAIEKGKMSS